MVLLNHTKLIKCHQFIEKNNLKNLKNNFENFLHVISGVCPQKIRSLGIDTIFDAIFYEDWIKNKVYNC